MARLSTRIRDLKRASAFAHAGAQLARAASAVETANRGWSFPSPEDQSLLKGHRYANSNWGEATNRLNVVADGTGMRTAGPMNLAAQLSRAIESGKAVHAMEAARRVAPGLIPKAGASSRVVEELEAKPPSHLPADPKANLLVVLSTRALAGLQTFHARELAHPFSKPNQGNTTQKITINSSPTVVINAAAPGSNVRHEVIEALRAHRDELFDQLKRESARRERAQF